MDGFLPLGVAMPRVAPGRPLIVDSFAGGGGASTGIEMALGRSPDIAINHDARALDMHAANHPETRHMSLDIWGIDPLDAVGDSAIDAAWFSPDCKDFSRAKGGTPVSRNIRDLAWVVVDWMKKSPPRIVFVENVAEFRQWGPTIRVFRKGEWIEAPDPARRGETFKKWVRAMRRLGYRVEWRVSRACDYGAPTIRKRLLVIARRDGEPIVWPAPTHGAPDDPRVIAGELAPWRTAGEIIDWSIPCPSIFDTRAQIKERYGVWAKRPLEPNTLKRIAAGVRRYVLDAAEPFIVTNTTGHAPGSIHTSLATIATGGHHGLVVPTLVQTGYGEAPGQAPRVPGLDKPLGTLVAGGGKHALVAAFLAQHNSDGQGGVNPGRRVDAPVSTITSTGSQQGVVAAHLLSLKGSARRSADIGVPHPAICAGGGHSALVAAFMIKYYGTGDGASLADPAPTTTTRDRFGLVTVQVDGETYAIADIGLRMLTPRELFRAQGFPDDYEIDRDLDGRAFTKSDQVAKVGNSVSPPWTAAHVAANCGWLA